ncbi:hypothetical protein EV426DRAFT_606168 [Tirmania nivea]|nr:hypothetical protein EV426DRAFT_606168 [Tirmania nivea]
MTRSSGLHSRGVHGSSSWCLWPILLSILADGTVPRYSNIYTFLLLGTATWVRLHLRKCTYATGFDLKHTLWIRDLEWDINTLENSLFLQVMDGLCSSTRAFVPYKFVIVNTRKPRSWFATKSMVMIEKPLDFIFQS